VSQALAPCFTSAGFRITSTRCVTNKCNLMENNAFIKRRSLTLSTRLLQKRHSGECFALFGAPIVPRIPTKPTLSTASPQSCGRPGNGHDVSVSLGSPGSPNDSTIGGITSDVESTPPHKHKPNLDDSVDFSPRLDISLSPNCLFSQTLATDGGLGRPAAVAISGQSNTVG